MEYLTLPGESCYTQAETEKLKKAILARGGPKVLNLQGCWVHYVRLGQRDSVGFPSEHEKAPC
jgi:phosphoribosylformylglycinamidine synthase